MKELIQKYKDTETVAGHDIYLSPPHLRAGHEMNVRQARIALKTIRQSIMDSVFPERAVAIFATGDSEKIQEVASFLRKNQAAVIDAGEFYDNLAEGMEPSFGPERRFGMTQYSILLRTFQEAAATHSLDTGKQPEPVASNCYDKNQTVDLCKKLVRTAVGDKLTDLILKEQTVKQVLVNSISSDTIPVLVFNFSPEEVEGLSSSFKKTVHFSFDSEFKVNKANVLKVLKGEE